MGLAAAVVVWEGTALKCRKECVTEKSKECERSVARYIKGEFGLRMSVCVACLDFPRLSLNLCRER